MFLTLTLTIAKHDDCVCDNIVSNSRKKATSSRCSYRRQRRMPRVREVGCWFILLLAGPEINDSEFSTDTHVYTSCCTQNGDIAQKPVIELNTCTAAEYRSNIVWRHPLMTDHSARFWRTVSNVRRIFCFCSFRFFSWKLWNSQRLWPSRHV